jgi:poly(beta-D-mannuronate) lyase
MKKYLLLTLTVLILLSCNVNSKQERVFVKDIAQLEKAIKLANPGDVIVLSNGVWKDAQIAFYGLGTESQPITLRAEEAGKVFIEGESYLHLGGEHLNVEGLYFKNGYSPTSSIIGFQINEDSTAFNCKVTNCVIENFTKPSRLSNDHWIDFFGKHNILDHCYIAGKSNDGETIRVFQTGNKHNKNHHQITNNYFGPRPRKGGPRGETIRIGDSKTHMTPGYVTVSNNFFDACNGEVETISDKTNFNTFRNNIFYKCEGSLVLRHGSFATVDGNIFIGGDESDFYGGVRVVNTGHWITNNYFYKINGSKFRSPLAIMNGIPKSQLNRYRQVTDVVVAYNTWVDCKSTWQVGVGQNMKSADVLPEVEIRSAPPIRSIIANNMIYNHQADQTPVINHDKIDGILFTNNIIDNHGKEFSQFNAVQNQELKMKQLNEWLFVPEEEQAAVLDDVYEGYDFEKIKKDLLGNSRTDQNRVGAFNRLAAAEKFAIDKKKYGPSWYSSEATAKTANVITASAADGELAVKIAEAQDGDIIELSDELYLLTEPLKIDKEITIRSKGEKKTQLLYKGAKNTPVFEMNPYGDIKLSKLSLKGSADQMTFATLPENMRAAYKISINACDIEEFACILEASKGSFADSIHLQNTSIKNCKRGIILAAEEKGDYNAEMLTIENCTFTNIQSDVINFYRGGYDESTIGGCLSIQNSSFQNCGSKEKTGTLLKTRGIVNVSISGNTFQNNPIKLVALLWGEKNNHESNNTLIQSGEIKVEEQQKLEILY